MTTTYGTIPSSSIPKHVSGSEQRIEATLGIHRSWKTTFNFSSFSLPRGAGAAVSRIRINLLFFRRNYAEIAYACLISWFPISLFAAAIAVWSFVFFVRSGATVVLLGRPIDDRVVLTVMCAFTEVVLHLLVHHAEVEELNSTAVILVAVTVAATVATHAMLRKTEDLFSEEEEEDQGTLIRNYGAILPVVLLGVGSIIARAYA